MAEGIQWILKRRALGDRRPEVTRQIIGWFEAAERWNASPTPFAWDGKRMERRRLQREQSYRVGGFRACTGAAPTAGPDRLWPRPTQMTHELSSGVVPCPMLLIAVTAEGARLMVVLRSRWEFDAAPPNSLERLEDLMEHLAGPEVRLP